MASDDIQFIMHFEEEDKAWLRMTKVETPNFWQGHGIAPAAGDVVRLGGRQFTVNGRVWDHDGVRAQLRIYLGSGHALSDTVFDNSLH